MGLAGEGEGEACGMLGMPELDCDCSGAEGTEETTTTGVLVRGGVTGVLGTTEGTGEEPG